MKLGFLHFSHWICFFQYKMKAQLLKFNMSINSHSSLSSLTVFTLSHLIMAAAISAEPVDPVKMVDSFEAAGGKFEGYRRSGAM
jgi:hypothetical protein